MMTMLTERALWILRLVVMVLSAVSALMSFSRGDTTGVVIFGLLSALFLYQLIRHSSVARMMTATTGLLRAHERRRRRHPPP